MMIILANDDGERLDIVEFSDEDYARHVMQIARIEQARSQRLRS